MKQLTVWGLEPELERRLRATARARGVPLNKAALDLMRQAAGLATDEPRSSVIGDGLDAFIGSWDEVEERQVLDAVRVFETVDEGLWR